MVQQDAEPQIPAIAADGTLYAIGKWAAHRQAVRHLAVSVFIFNENGQLLMQRRAAKKYHAAGLWANSCCTHPHILGSAVENSADAAERRLGEELGFHVPLFKGRTLEYRADVGSGMIEWECVTMFSARVNASHIDLNLNPEEVSEFSWASADMLNDMARKNPKMFAPWFKLYLDRFPTLAI